MNTLKSVSSVVDSFMEPKVPTTLDGSFDQEFIVIKEHMLRKTTLDLVESDRQHTKEVLIERLRKEKSNEISDLQCPVCGFYCNGSGGNGCIDKRTQHIGELRFNEGIDQAIALVEEVYKSE